MSTESVPKRSLVADLRVFIGLANEGSKSWLIFAIIGSILLAALDTIGVAAMLPLMQLLVVEPDLSTGVLAVVSDILGTQDVATLITWLAALVAVLFILKSAFTIPFRWWLVGKTTRIAANAATELFRRYLHSTYQVHKRRNLAEVYRNIGDSTFQASNVLQSILSLATDVLLIIAILIVLLVASPLATVLALVLFGALVGGIQLLTRRRQRRIGEELAAASLKGWQFLRPALDGFREVRLAGSEDSFVDGYGAARRRSAAAQRSLAVVSELPKYLLEIGFVLMIALMAVVLFAFGDAAGALATMGVFAAAAMRALPTLNRLSATFVIIRSGEVGLGLVCNAVESLDREPRNPEPATSGVAFEGDITLTDVSYRYEDGDSNVLSNIDLTIKHGTTVAFVGASGAGKSTLLDLILGMVTPTSGTVASGGRDIAEDRRQWFRQLGVVPQDVYLLNETLASNVMFDVSGTRSDDSGVIDALALAELSDFTAGLPSGINTTLGERGVRLSGGQRQRIGLARALYRRPHTLVLDEATSALDNETEFQIANTLERLKGSMTVIIVAHRLSTVRRADVVHYMEGGRIVASGTFEQVREANSEFARLVELGELN